MISAARKKVLIVEDSYIAAMHLQRTLEIVGYEVSGVADSFESAIEIAAKENPDIVFMDVMLEGEKDGIQTAVHLWDRYKIPVVFITALSDKATLARIKEAHGYAYLTKPFQDKDVINALELALYKYEADLALHNSREQFYAVVQSISDPLITINEHFKVTYLNPSAESLTGWVISKAIGKYFNEVFQVIDVNTRMPIESPLFCNAYQKGNSILDHFLLISRQGHEVPVGDGSISPILGPTGDFQGMVIVFKNLWLYYDRLHQEEKLAQEKKLAIQRGEENERKRIARDLHDGLGQLLNAIKMKADTLASQTEEVKEISGLMDGAIDEVKRIADELLPSQLRHFNLATALKSLCQNQSLVFGIKIAFAGSEVILTYEKQLSLYRIVQEGINNAIKYSRSSLIEVDLEERENMLHLKIQDHGKGFDLAAVNHRNGLVNIEERVALLNGTVNIHSVPGRGTVIDLTIPLHERERKENSLN